jgi:hypothetical protein
MSYDIPQAIHEEMCNWSAWTWIGQWPHPLPATECGSAEGDYRAPPEWGSEEAPDPPRIKPHIKSALMVQAVWESFPVGSLPRLCMKSEYPGRHTSGRAQGGRETAARRMGISVRQYEDALRTAVGRVEQTFLLPA